MKADTQIPLKYDNLIDVFEHSMSQGHIESVVCLEVLRTDLSESMTFGELNVRVRTFASQLAGLHAIVRSDKVAIVAKNRCDWDVVLWGTLLVGAVPVLIDPERPPQAVMHHLEHTGVRVLAMGGDYRDADSRAELTQSARAQGIDVVEMNGSVGLGDPLESSAGPESVFQEARKSVALDDTAVILCTSGTTGDPREVELTHRNLLANIQGSLETIHINRTDKLVHIIPAHHSFGLTVGKLLTLSVGATNIYTNKYRNIGQIIASRKATMFISIPALFMVMARKLEDAIAQQKKSSRLVAFLDRWMPKVLGRTIKKKQGWETVRFFLSGAAAMPHWVLEVFWKYGLHLYQGYGTTENSPVYGFCEDRHRLGSVGKPIKTLYVRIVNNEGEPLPTGQRGEILLGGPCIMKGYYKNPASTETTIFTDDEGVRWLHTGDLGYLDKDGYLYITGRKKYIIVLPSGKNINPELIEGALSGARFIGEVLVLPGSKQSGAGGHEETVRAVIHPDWEQLAAHTNDTQEELMKKPQLVRNLIWQSVQECQQGSSHLSPFERVASKQNIEIVSDGFQKTSTGKIRREAYLNA